ncbi:MAG TPA: glycosyltransferase family 9 protein [Candidatus Binatia bacterium]|nr:glycosyltransferase family 9 protein [Candidatus Binatia bacterium]
MSGADSPERIAVRLPNWLGDTVMAVPALSALRGAWPDAEVLAAGPWAPLLAGQGLAEVLLAYPRSWSGRLRAADSLARFGPGVAILLPSSLEAALAAWYSGARRRIGFARGGRAELLTDAVPVPEPRLHQVDEYLLLTERAGAPGVTREPRLAPPAADSPERAEAARLLRESGVPPRGSSPRIGVQLGAAYGPSKLWPGERVVEFCRLASDKGATPVLLGAPDDAATAAAITASVRVASLVGRDRPALLPAELAELDALVSGDTGVAHLAAALGTPVATLFGPTDPRLSAPRGHAAVSLTHPVPCAPCFYRACPIEHPCLRGIAAAAVYDRARALIEERRA